MTLASLGWGTWWVVFFLRKLAEWTPELAVPSVVSCTFATFGLGLALATLRARRSWMLFVAIPLLANGALFFVPWLAGEALKP